MYFLSWLSGRKDWLQERGGRTGVTLAQLSIFPSGPALPEGVAVGVGVEHSGKISWRRSELGLSFEGQVTRKIISEYRVRPSRQDETSWPVSAGLC